MQVIRLIPTYNDINATTTPSFSPITGEVYSPNRDLNNDNNSGLLFVNQMAAGNVNAQAQVWGSIDNVNFSPLVTGVVFTTANAGTQQNLAYTVSLPPFIRLRLTAPAHSSNMARSGVEVWAIY
jgi:hypothetical protein